MDRIEHLAEISVARGCAFAALAIFTLTVGLLGMPAMALKTAGGAALLTAVILWLKARLAQTRPYKRTELWLMLKPAERPGPAVAQTVIGRALRECYLKFALRFSTGASVLLALGLVVGWGQAGTVMG